MKQLAVAGCIVFLLVGADVGATQEQKDKDQEGVEVLLRAPMHEAYAAPQSLDVKPNPIVPKKPPEPVPELPPEQKADGAHVVWISGYWAWDDEPAQFVWISGFWRDTPPGQRWVPGHWMEVGGGWQWVSGLWVSDTLTEVTYVPPPPPSLETGPSADAPEADQFYSPGCWVFVQRQYRWRPGFWTRHRPSWVYIPAHYCWTPAGCVFVDGYWDYEITRRGLLFCPVRFTADVWTRPGWRLHPRFVVYPEVIVGSLFVRADFHRFYFGDYFGAKFAPHGFVPWVDYRLHRNVPEPLFAQYAWSNRKDQTWERDLRKLYEDRRLGNALRPPHTIAEQQRFLREMAANKAVKVGDKVFKVDNVAALQRTVRMSETVVKFEHKDIPIKTLTKEAHAEVIKGVEHRAEVKQVRKVTETKIFKDAPPIKPTDMHHIGKLPELPMSLKAPAHPMLPTIPTLPKHEEKVIPKYDPPKPPKLGTKPLHGRIDPLLPIERVALQWESAPIRLVVIARRCV